MSLPYMDFWEAATPFKPDNLLRLLYVFPRLSKNTACSPNRFQNHHGIFSRMRPPHALSATACSILAPAPWHNSRKSLMLQKWMFGVSYQAFEVGIGVTLNHGESFSDTFVDALA